MKLYRFLIVCIISLSCTNSDDVEGDSTLENYIMNKTVNNGAVIACAASDTETNDVLVFYYPETGASNIRLYETIDAEVDGNMFSNYDRIEINPLPLFNGYLEKVVRSLQNEKRIIVTFELNGEINVSNPIHVKQTSKPSVWSNDVSINQETAQMPKFVWENNAFNDNAIYFQVISDAQDNLLSGTYTYENQFQYYNITNVVLNITTQIPPSLLIGSSYNFTLMDVSEDNWVNTIVQKTFVVQ